MYGYMTVGLLTYIKFVKLDSSDNLMYTTAYLGYPSLPALDIDNQETKIFALVRVTGSFDLSIFNTSNGAYLQRMTTNLLSSASHHSILVLDFSNEMALISVNDDSGNLAIWKYNILNQSFNWIKANGPAIPKWLWVVSSADDLFYTTVISTSIILQRIK